MKKFKIIYKMYNWIERSMEVEAENQAAAEWKILQLEGPENAHIQWCEEIVEDNMPRIIIETHHGEELTVHGAQDYFILDYSLLERDECPICHLRPMSGEVPEEFVFKPGRNDRICPQCDINWNNCAWVDVVIRIDEVVSNE